MLDRARVFTDKPLGQIQLIFFIVMETIFKQPRTYRALMIVGLCCVVGVKCALLFPTVKEELPRATGYQLNVPKHWKTDNRAQGDQAYATPFGSLVTVTSSCTRNTDAPLELLTKHLLIGSRNIVIDKRERLKINGADGLHSQVRATLEGNPFHLEIFVLPKSGCVFDFSLISRAPITAQESKEFGSFIRSFRYERAQ